MEEESKPIEQMRFREAMAELDQIVGKLESNTMELEDSLRSYERGVALLTFMQESLGKAQQTITTLSGKLEGELTDQQRDSMLS